MTIKTVLFALILFSSLESVIAQEHYYWAYGKKYPLEFYPEKQYVLVKGQGKETVVQGLGISANEVSDLKQLIVSQTIKNNKPDKSRNNTDLHWGFVNHLIDKEAVKSSDYIIYAAPSFLANGKEVGLSQFFCVKLKQEQDFGLLSRMAEENRVEITGNDSFMPLWYVLSCDKNSRGNALEMANLFYETGRFSSAQPDLMEDHVVACTDDPLFNQQWHLRNTGQSGGAFGNDIRICEAWGITMGCDNITVAVLDNGLEFNHPDFDNIGSVSFDSETGTSPSIIQGPHGVAVAGVIGATANNGLGISGVAPGVQLMSISNSLDPTPLSRQNRAAGINFAWENGADVINNSWISTVVYQVIDDAIDQAVTQGRGGLGTIVVFASGNDNNNSIGYPSSNANVISVGAIKRTPSRANFSNYGTGLDVVAPGVSISTTDRQGVLGYNSTAGVDGNYTSIDGTSFAAPQVSAIAALILSLNPGLTQQQVRFIIESTTDQIGGYTYTIGAGEHSTLAWNNQMGYGRVNALKALRAVYSIIGDSVVCSGETFTLNNVPTGWTVSWSSSNLSGLSIDSSTGVSERQNNFNGEVTITATISGDCQPFDIERNVWVGVPTFEGYYLGGQHFDYNPGGLIITSYSVCPSEQLTFFPQSYIYEFLEHEWTISGSYQQVGSLNVPNLLVTASNLVFQTFQINYRARNTCGWGPWRSGSATTMNCEGGEEPDFVYPNPANQSFNVSVPLFESSELRLYNDKRELVYTIKPETETITVPVNNQPTGTYYLNIINKEGVIQKRVIVKH